MANTSPEGIDEQSYMFRAAVAVGAAIWLGRVLLSRRARTELRRTLDELRGTNALVNHRLQELYALRPEMPQWRALRMRVLRNMRLRVPADLRGPGFFARQEIRREVLRRWRKFPRERAPLQ
jgi:hypothetical protein